MNNKNKLSIIILSILLTTYAYAKDEITFNCTAIGNGFQSSDKSGPWRYELGGFKWQYNAEMIKPKQKIKLKNGQYGCEPADIESPKIFLDKKKSIYISGHRCGDSPSYFFAVTNFNNIKMNHALGYAEDVFRNKEVRIIFESENDDRIKVKDKKFHNIYFDCHLQ